MAKRQINCNAEIVFTCSEAYDYKGELTVEEHSLVHVVSGELKVIQADHTFHFETGETHLFPRNQMATLIKNEKHGLPYKAIVVKLTNENLRAFYEDKKVEVTPTFKTYKIIPLQNSVLLDSFFASILPYFNLHYKLPRELSELKIQEAITVLREIDKNVDGILSDFSEPHKINLAEFMERNYLFNMPIEKFAYLTGRSLTTFKRDFKKAFNTTPQKWLTKKRWELAHYQIVEKNRKSIDVYLETGFENLSNFSFAFKKQFGYAPNKLVIAK